jgi:hypothetical protein
MIGKKTNLEKGKEERQSIPKQTTLFVVFLFFIFYFLFFIFYFYRKMEDAVG